jgi:hypothetical protein
VQRSGGGYRGSGVRFEAFRRDVIGLDERMMTPRRRGGRNLGQGESMAIRFELMFDNGNMILQVPPEGIAVYGNDGFPSTHTLPDGAVFTIAVEGMIDGESGERISTGMSDEILKRLTSTHRPKS